MTRNICQRTAVTEKAGQGNRSREFCVIEVCAEVISSAGDSLVVPVAGPVVLQPPRVITDIFSKNTHVAAICWSDRHC